MILQMFFNAKSEEIIGIFKGATLAEKTVVVDLLSRLDAPRASKYDAIME